MKRTIYLVLAIIIAFSLVPKPSQAALTPNPIMRIGFYYGASALIAANLQNSVGQGYEFGYLDANRAFVPLGKTNETKITMVKNRSVYVDSSANYTETQTNGSKLVGAYHESLGKYGTREEAEAAAASYRSSSVAAFVSYDNGVYYVRANSYTGSNGGTYVTGSKYCVSVVITGTNDIIFQYDGGEKSWLCVRPVSDNVQAVTWFKGLRYYGMFEYRRFDGNDLYVYNTIDMQSYLKCVITSEMGSSWPLEALKAQTMCAKSYAVSSLNRHSSAGFDLCASTHCQAYNGMLNCTPESNKAVDETYGYYMVYNGSPCNTVYHSSNGGATENSENVWTNTVPYLKGVLDPYEDLTKAHNGIWSYTVTNDILTQFLNQRGSANTGVVDFFVEKFTDIGNVLTVTILDSSGKKFQFSKENARTSLKNTSLGIENHSMRYTISSGNASLTVRSSSATQSISNLTTLYALGGNGQTVTLPAAANIGIMSASGLFSIPTTSGSKGVYTVNGRGWGHNVGMSQWGARGMAERGYGFMDILTHYFTGTEVVYTGANS